MPNIASEAKPASIIPAVTVQTNFTAEPFSASGS
jgi:hypothetical protein